MTSTTYARAAGPAGPADAAPGGAPTTLLADDGRALAATWTEPAGRGAHAVAVVSPATGVPRGFYRGFAQWLATRGYAVLTYDYRGIGGSRAAGPLARERATMRDWALRDMSAALAAAEARRGGRGLPLLLVGHSFGGNAIGFARGVERADALLLVAAGLGESRLYPGRHGVQAHAFFRAVLPAAVATFGHLPGWLLGGEPLPPGVARDWARWGGTRGWAMGDPAMRVHSSYRGIAAPVHVWNVSDDLSFAPPRAVDALAAAFPLAAVQRHTLAPAQAGGARLGHFGAFRRDVGPQVWPRLLAPLDAAVPALQSPDDRDRGARGAAAAGHRDGRRDPAVDG